MKLHRIAVPLALMAGSVLFFLLAMEIALRVIDYPRREAKILCLDPIMGNVYCPNLETPLNNMYESTLVVKFNSEGMADREYPLTKSVETVRVALLGDSLTASLYMPAEQKFKSIWELSLSQHLGRPVEFMNFAVDGTGTWEQLQMFHLRARQFKPDYVVLAFFWGNDVQNNENARYKGRPNPLKDEYGAPSWLRSFQAKHRKSIRWLWNHSAAFQFLDILKDRIDARFNVERTQRKAQAQEAPSGSNEPPALQYGAAFDWESESWELTRRLILKLKQEAEQSEARLLVFHLPFYDQLVMPKSLPYAEFNRFLDSNGIAHADAFTALADMSAKQKRDLYIGDRVHLTAAGHRVFAEAGLSALRKFMSPPSGREKVSATR